MGTVWKYLLAKLIVVVIFVPGFVICCIGISPHYGNMTKDYDLEVGSPLKVQCTLFTNVILNNGSEYYVTSDNLMIKFGNNSLSKLDIINEYTVEYSVDNATVNDSGIYNCFLSIQGLEFNPFICTTYVSVGYPPLPVKNFSCISLNYERLNCSWEKPFNPVKTKYVLYDHFGRFSRLCPIALDNSCEFRLDSYPPYRKSTKILYLTLNGTNSLGTNKQHINIDHYKIVKPSNPQRMIFTNVTKNSVLVHWLPPKGMEYNDFPPGITYSLQYCPLFHNYPELCGIINQKNSTSCLVTNLRPNLEYKFMLRCRSNVADNDDMWSPFLNSSVRMKPDVPYLAPELTDAAFQVQNTQSNRTITLYWKPVQSYCENGEGFQYVVQCHLHYVPHRSKRANFELQVGNGTSYEFTHMDPSSAYLFRIYAKNNVGISSNSSVIVVDKADNLLHGPTGISVLSYGKGKYIISWKNSDQNRGHSIQNYTLFWCQNIKPRPFKCEGPLEWMTVVGTYQEMKLYDSTTNYQFAVAANGGHMTSGMKWASCVVPYHGVLYKVNDVILTPKNSTSVRVHWMLDCGAQRNVVQEYAITYCSVHLNLSCSGKSHTIYLKNQSAEQHIVGGLEPYTTYKFTVAARTSDGWSENSAIKYESTMSAAPSDPPRQVKLLDVNGKVIKISFHPPLKPNGKITQYLVRYGSSSSSPGEKYIIYFPVEKPESEYEAKINKSGIHFFTNYSIEVAACVGLACSPLSKPIFAFTAIGSPGPMDPPIAEIINSTLVNVTWNSPSAPNGPIDLYQLIMEWKESDDYDVTGPEIKRELFNISGRDNYMSVSVDCQQEVSNGVVYLFSIQAINVKNGTFLYSQRSKRTQTRLCFISNNNGMSIRLLIGLIVGIAVGLTFLVLSIYALAKWMKKKVDMVKGITVQLPTGLDSPIENPLNTYDKFKSGLQKNGDAGIPSERTYERLCSYASDKMSKDIENSFDASCEEFRNSNREREKSGRNQSGDSNISGKGHDSISSSNTNKTHISIDSGAEMDLPPSPDGIFSDTSSSNTTPRSYKPDLEIVEENNPSSSKDSGLEKEGISRLPFIINSAHVDHSSRFPYYIRKKGHPFFIPQPFKKNGQMQPYSKFAIIAPVFTPNYVSVGVHNIHLLEQQSLSNSEPSVAELQNNSDSEPLVSGVAPYCRFGIARSAGNGLNISNQLLPVQENLGYSKFGVIYSPVEKPGNIQSGVGTPNYSKITCPKVTPHLNNFSVQGQPLSPSKKSLTVVEEKLDSPVESEQLCNEDLSSLNDQKDTLDNLSLDKANGTEEVPIINKQSLNNGYVSFNHALSDLGVTNVIHTKPKGYVSFQDAKVMSQHDSQPEYCNVHKTDLLVENPNLNCAADQNENIVQSHGSPEAKHESLLELSEIKLPSEETENTFVPFTASDDYSNKDSCPQDPEVLKDCSSHDLARILPEESLDYACTKIPTIDLSEPSALPQAEANIVQEILDTPKEISVFSQPVDHCTPSGANKHQSTSNGYVTWSELLGSNPADVSTLSNGTNNLHVEHI